jgi:hypothetical protein
MHEEHMGSAGNIRMNRNRKDANLILIICHVSVEVIEVVSPKILDISRIHPSMTVGGILDEHHRRQAVVHLY